MASSLKQSILDHCTKSTADHIALGECAKNQGDIYRAMDGDGFQKLAATCDQTSAAHADRAQSYLALAKNLKDTPEVSQETRVGSSELQNAMLGEMGDKIVPDKIRGSFAEPARATITALPRTGGPSINTAGVPAEFLDLVKVD